MYVDNTTVCNLYAIIILLFYLRVSFVLMFFFIFVFYAYELYIVLFVLHMP